MGCRCLRTTTSTAPVRGPWWSWFHTSSFAISFWSFRWRGPPNAVSALQCRDLGSRALPSAAFELPLGLFGVMFLPPPPPPLPLWVAASSPRRLCATVVALWAPCSWRRHRHPLGALVGCIHTMSPLRVLFGIIGGRVRFRQGVGVAVGGRCWNKPSPITPQSRRGGGTGNTAGRWEAQRGRGQESSTQVVEGEAPGWRREDITPEDPARQRTTSPAG